jgi:hypothetical protein
MLLAHDKALEAAFDRTLAFVQASQLARRAAVTYASLDATGAVSKALGVTVRSLTRWRRVLTTAARVVPVVLVTLLAVALLRAPLHPIDWMLGHDLLTSYRGERAAQRQRR